MHLNLSSNIDVLFVHPNASGAVYQDLSKDLSAIEPPIWAAMLAQRARQDGYAVDILDCEAERIEAREAAARIAQINPKLLVIVVYGQQPSASTQNMTGAEEVASEFFFDYPETTQILFVGAHVSALPERTLEDNPWSMVCQGEGPETIKGLLEGKTLSTVPGLWYYDDKSVIHNNAPAPLIKDLDQGLPGMAWDLLPMDKYRTSNWHAMSNDNDREPFASIYTSLGCPFACSFCMINVPFGGSSFRFWSPEVIIEEFQKIHDMGIRNVKIADEMFVLQQRHFMKVCELIIERGFDFNIWAYSRIDTVKEEYLPTLAKAGVKWLALGIESASVKVRSDVTKGQFEDVKITDIVEKIQSYDINVIGNFIFGLPEDDLESMQETLDLALNLKCEFANFYSAMAYPGSPLYTHALDEGWELPHSWEGYSQHSVETQPLPTKHITAKEVLAFRDHAFNVYYADPAYLVFIKKRFGNETHDHICSMAKKTLKRKLTDAK